MLTRLVNPTLECRAALGDLVQRDDEVRFR